MSLLTDEIIEPVELRPRPPAPDDRWRPTRAGLVNVWRYWDEVFTFHDGRLLLRGPNGSGKSMALELLLPFLLDGDASPGKLTSAAKSRGGLYERVMTGTTDTTRAGFAWVELRKGDRTFTAGVRLRASASTKTVTRTLFTTSQAIGRELHLLDSSRVPISRRALLEAIGEHGRVTDSASEHRDAVRASLFPEFGADRYEALIGALLALRKEKLSQHLDLDKFSEVMSEALPTIDEHELATVAEGFERLDRRRERIAELERDVAELEELGRRQRAYARAVTAALADEVRGAESARDGVVRRQRLAADEQAEVIAALAAVAEDEARVRDRLRDVGGELDGIRTSDQYREGASLAQLQHDLGERTAERDRLDHDRTERQHDIDDAQRSVTDGEAEQAAAAANLGGAERELRSLAEEAGAGATLDEALAADDREHAAALLNAWVGEREEAIAEIRALLAEHGRAVDRRADAETHLEAQRARVDELTAARRRALAAVEDERGAFAAAVSTWSDTSASFTDRWRALVRRALRGLLPERDPAGAPGTAPDVAPRAGQVVTGQEDRGVTTGGDGPAALHAGAPGSASLDLVAGDRDATLAGSGDSTAPPTGPVAEPGPDEGRVVQRDHTSATAGDVVTEDTAAGRVEVVEVVDAVDAAVAQLRAEHVDATARSRADLRHRRAALDEEQAGLQRELAPLLEGGWPEVPAPPWRASRAEPRQGAPLWRLVDVAEGTPEGVVDGLEAALVAAGLADAWVSPLGHVEMPAEADVMLTVLDVDRRPAASLADHLCPGAEVGDLGVSADIVDAVLRSVATAPTAPITSANRKLVIGLDGTFRSGSAVGRGPATPAILLGAAARERHRQAEIERVRGLIGECGHRCRLLDAEATQLETGAAAVVADLDARPSRRPHDEAAAALGEAEVRLGEADSARVAAEQAVHQAEERVRRAQRQLATRAMDVGAPADPAGLDQLAAAVVAVREAAGVWRRRADDHATRARQVAQLRDSHERAERAAVAARDRWQAAADAVAVLDARIEAIRATLGSGYDEMLARVASLEGEQRDLGEERDIVQRRQIDLATRKGTVEEALKTATVALEHAEATRTEVHARFVDLHAGSLPADASLTPPAEPLDGVTAVLTRARVVATELDGVAAGADDVDRLSHRVEGRLHDARAVLGVRVDLERVRTPNGWHEVRGSTGGVRQVLVELRGHLGRQLADAHAELQAEEAELFERTLSGSIRQALADRIRGANELVTAINRQLAEVQTAAAGVAVKLRWAVDDDQPDAVRAARSLLLRDPADLSDEERAALTDFVRARVDQARAELEAHAPWEARLRESLDYRAWHRFSLQVAHRDWEGFKPATPKLLQRLSTGERSVALHLPMIASLAAHYTGPDGAPAEGPRLILLDELFAGVDTNNRAQLFGTFTTWDLDAVFTSDHEWCQYATLQGIAIHHLQGGRDDEPVTSTRFTWDGAQRRLDDGADAA